MWHDTNYEDFSSTAFTVFEIRVQRAGRSRDGIRYSQITIAIPSTASVSLSAGGFTKTKIEIDSVIVSVAMAMSLARQGMV